MAKTLRGSQATRCFSNAQFGSQRCRYLWSLLRPTLKAINKKKRAAESEMEEEVNTKQPKRESAPKAKSKAKAKAKNKGKAKSQ